jgi:hypothetical protein
MSDGRAMKFKIAQHLSVGRGSTQSGARALVTGGARDGSPRLSRVSRAGSSS